MDPWRTNIENMELKCDILEGPLGMEAEGIPPVLRHMMRLLER